MAKQKSNKKVKNNLLNVTELENYLYDISYLNMIGLHAIKNCYFINKRSLDYSNILPDDVDTQVLECITITNSELNKIKEKINVSIYSEKQKIQMKEFIREVNVLLDCIYSRNRELSLKQLKQIRASYKNMHSVLFNLCFYLTPIANTLIDTLILVIRIVTLKDNISFTGSNEFGYNKEILMYDLEQKHILNLPKQFHYRHVLIQQLVFDRLLCEATDNKVIYGRVFNPKRTYLDNYIKIKGYKLNKDLNHISNIDVDAYDRIIFVVSEFISEMKSIYFNKYSPHNLKIGDENYTFMKIPVEKIKTRRKIVPESGFIHKIIIDGKVHSEIEVKEIHTKTTHGFILKLMLALDDGSLWSNIYSLDMENPILYAPLDILLNIGWVLSEIGIISEEDTSMEYIYTAEGDCITDLIPIDTDVSKTLSLASVKKSIIDEGKNVVIEFEKPESWNFRNRFHRINNNGLNKNNKIKPEEDKVAKFIDLHTRNIKGKASPEAIAYAKKLFIEVGDGITIVQPHIRRM